MLVIILGLLLGFVRQVLPYKIGVLASCSSTYTRAYKQISEFAESKLENKKVGVIFQCYDQTSIQGYQTMCAMMEKHVVAVITLGGSSQVAKEAEFFSQVNIPIISVGASNPFLLSSSRKFLIRMVPPDTFQGEAIFHLIKHFRWKDISILGSADDYGINGLIKLQDLISRDRDITIRNIQYFDTLDIQNSTLQIEGNLRLISDSLTKIVVLNCDAVNGAKILAIAQKMGLTSQGYVWITTDSITSRPQVLLESVRHESVYDGLIGTMQAFEVNKEFKNSYMASGGLSTDVSLWTSILYDAIILSSKAISPVYHIPRQTCDNPTPWQDGSRYLNEIKKSNFQGVSGYISFDHNGLIRRSRYDIKNKRKDTFIKIGQWGEQSDLQIVEDTKIRFLGDPKGTPTSEINTLSGQKLVLGTIREAPYAYRNNSLSCIGHEDEPQCWYGFCIDLNNKLAKDLNFTYTLVEPPDKEYGRFDQDRGRYTGLVFELQERNIDLASAPLTINTERSKAVDFLSDIIHVKSTSVYLSGSEAYSNRFFFLGPLDPFVWASIVAVIFFLGVLITCLNYISPVSRYNREQGGDKSPSVYNNVFIVASGFVGREGGDGIPESPAARFMLIAWWFFTTIIISMYTANLTAFVTLDQAGSNIKSLKDLINHDHAFKWGMLSGAATEITLKSHENSDFTKLAQISLGLSDTSEAAKEVDKGKFVFIDEDITIDYMFRNYCNITIFNNELQSSGITYAVPKNSPYKALLSNQLLRYVENGYIQTVKDKWLKASERYCPNSNFGSTQPFTIQILSGLFILLSIAMGISFVLIIFELFYVTYTSWKKNPKINYITVLKTRIKRYYCQRGLNSKPSLKLSNHHALCDAEIEHLNCNNHANNKPDFHANKRLQG